MDKYLNDLTNAAKLKLEAQKEKSEPVEDIYASIRNEVDEEEEIDYSIPQMNIPNEDYHIPYEAENDSNEEYIIEEEEDPVFPGGPGMAQVNLWKKQYGNGKVMHTVVVDRHFIFRTLNRYEYKGIVALDSVDALQREEIICQTTVLWPYNYNFKKMAKEDSGYPSTLAKIIMESSGFTTEYGIEVL